MTKMNTLLNLRAYLEKGHVYRRKELVECFDKKGTTYSSSVDRYLRLLLKNGILKKLQNGMYFSPSMSVFGEVPPDEHSMLEKFLKDDCFVAYNFNDFNMLGLGTTQLYNRRVVFNRKRHGEYQLGGRTYFFRRWREAPRKLTREFLVVELLNQLSNLAEDREKILIVLRKKLNTFDEKSLEKHVKRYGTYSTQLKFKELTI